MLNEDISAAAMLEAEELLRLWAGSEDFTLFCGPGTEDAAGVLEDRYPGHRGAIELGIYMEPGTMAVSRALSTETLLEFPAD